MRREQVSLHTMWRRRSAGLRAYLQTPERRYHVLALIGATFVLAAAGFKLLSPFFQSVSTFGFHDWDVQSVYRYITVISLKRYHEPPWWHPWLCGGFPAWAYVEGATNFVSPYLPLYLTLPVQVAERLEIVGGATLGVVSTYLLAGRFTKSVAVRTLVAVAYAINGRWALQISTGHTWHLQYAWLPLALLFFDISLDPGKRVWAFLAGLVLAQEIYSGAIYPLPHTALLLIVYAGALAIVRRSARPIASLAMASLSGIGFAAPKLFPMIDMMRRYPRKVDSTEYVDLGQLVEMFANPNQAYGQGPVAVPRWGWHEYGIYVGPWIVLAMILGFVAATGPRAVVLKAAGLLFFLLGAGAFHPKAPWTLLHTLPAFSSQHVPTRFLFPAVLLLMLVFATLVARSLDPLIRRRPWIDVALLVPVYFVAMDIVGVGRKSTEHVFFMVAPPIQPRPEFHQAAVSPYNYTPGDWSGSTLLGMFANTGVVGCYGVPDDLVRGAIPETSNEYHGETHLVSKDGVPVGNARIVEWTTNRATVEYDQAPPGALLVYNMNYDPEWRVNGVPAVPYKSTVATSVSAGSGRVKFSYYPRTLNVALLVFVLTLTIAVQGWRRSGHRARADA
jgi:hypothetical protein